MPRSERLTPSEPIGYQPLALLLYLNGREMVLPLRSLPPLEEIRLPRVRPMTVQAKATLNMLRDDHHVFHLRPDLRSLWHRWWDTTQGPGQTPESAFVYFEVKHAS